MPGLKRVYNRTGRVKSILDSAKKTVDKLVKFENDCIEADRRGDPNRFDGFYKVIKEAAEEGKQMKHLTISMDLYYPACDIYNAKDTIEFLHDSIQDYLNANLSDGDDRLKLETITVSCENNTITYK